MKRHAGWVVLGVAVLAVVLLGRVGGSVLPAVTGSARDGSNGVLSVTLRSLTVAGAGTDTSAVVGNGGSLVLQSGYEVRAVAGVTARFTVRLERRTGPGRWSSTGRGTTITSGRPLVIRTPPLSTTQATQVVEYRLAAGRSTSNAVRITVEDQAKYVGLAARIYRYAEPYCPHTAVHLADLRGGEAGLYETGALLIRIDRSVGVRSDVHAADERALAVHECSHELQWVNYGGTPAGRTRMEADAARYFTDGDNGAKPSEHAADCGAKAVDPAGYLGYGGHCTARELAEGRRLLAGHRY